MAIPNQEVLEKRAKDLGATLNGIQQVFVSLHPDPDPTEARLKLHFHNSNELANIVAKIQTGADPKDIFPITGGHRLLAGPAVGQVQTVGVAAAAEPEVLMLTVKPIGDYSTYTLSVQHHNIDPVFSEIEFKFRPGCFTTNCAPEWTPAPVPAPAPNIDYLAKDYESFRHVMIAAMMERVPGWKPTSEADLDQMLLELFSAAADELSDFQDRVMNEAYLGSARKRVSLARHARLMDYHIHQGNQASTWLAVLLADGEIFDLPEGFEVGTGDVSDPSSIVFMTRRLQPMPMHHLLNQMGLYTWGDAYPALAAGSTTADLKLTKGGETAADTVRDLIQDGKVPHLLIQEQRNPATGKKSGRDPAKRQLLTPIAGTGLKGARTLKDPLANQFLVRVHWREELKANYCFTVDCPDGKKEDGVDVSRFYGNLTEVHHGKPASAMFKAPGEPVKNSKEPPEYHFTETHWGTLCSLPDDKGPLAYQRTPPGGEVPAESTLEVRVGPGIEPWPKWEEVISLIHSNESDDHFVVETDEERRSLIRFGERPNGRELPDKAEVLCSYQVGRGLDGNIGRDQLDTFDRGDPPGNHIEACWNPFDVTNGRDPELAAEIIRRVPEAYRFRQLRAVTLADYIDRAEQHELVSRAAARYAWTGSWRTVRVAVDPIDNWEIDETSRIEIARQLDAVRLIGEDLEIRPPRFVPLEIHVTLCVQEQYWPADVKSLLEQEFSDGYTADGRIAFFHPDRWTFGQPLRASQILGRLQSIKGIDHVIKLTMKRWNEVTPGAADTIEVRANEIIQVQNDPDHMERGFIDFDLEGGRA